MKFDNSTKLDYSDVLIKPQPTRTSSRNSVILHRKFKFKHSPIEYSGIPLITANMDTIGTLEMQHALQQHDVSAALHKHYDNYELVSRFNTNPNTAMFYSTGITDDNHTKLLNFVSTLNQPLSYLCVDVANGYQLTLVDYIIKLRKMKEFKNTVIMAGNVATKEGVLKLVRAGVDIVKIGIGPGAVCTTRVISGVGFPQLSAVIECAKAAHYQNAHICADGGCLSPGDVAKAFAAGADFVMLGSMLAGHDESGGDCVYDAGSITHKEYYGMASTTAMTKHNNGVSSYRSSEGKKVLVKYRGKVDSTILKILGGLRSACTYVDACKLSQLSEKTTFVKVNRTHNTSLGNEWQDD